MIAEGDTFAAKSIQVRRLQKCLAPIGAQKMRYEIGSPLVDDNEKYVLAVHEQPRVSGRLCAVRLFQAHEPIFKLP
jgi:hypothetical protein